jgi:hypothetical protein
VCCAPCPDPDDPNAGHISIDPEQCQQMDWECGATAFAAGSLSPLKNCSELQLFQ